MYTKGCDILHGNSEALNSVYRNCGMGCETLRVLIKSTRDKKMKALLTVQFKGYNDIKVKAQQLATAHNLKLKMIPRCDKCCAVIMAKMKIRNDKTSSKRAEMLIIGSTMGSVKALRNLRRYKDAKPDIICLTKKLLTFEENNITALKEYL